MGSSKRTSKIQWPLGMDWGTRRSENVEELLESDEDGRENDEMASEDANDDEEERRRGGTWQA